jgi:phenylalanyl-tRNA synthetase beta chain
MKVSYRWLQEYVKTTLSAPELADRYRMTSSEVEGVIDWNEKLANIVVGKIEKLIQHPDADRLRVATVTVGKETKTIVCGATNIEEGQTVLVALPGANLHPLKGESCTIEKTKLRGVTSEGMICGSDEIGIPITAVPKHIWVLDDSIAAGTSGAVALNLDDWVLDLEITPNRPDLLSHFGLARELAAFDKRKLIEPPILSLDKSADAQKQIEIVVDDHHGCHRYSGLCLTGVKAIQSPWWMQSRLILAGMRPVNAIVDVTNYVMLELGQPMHAFDLNELPLGNHKYPKMTVRSARVGETIKLLDETTRKLLPGDIIIADADDKPIDLAGIMGGDEGSISENTTHIFLESANFDGSSIRRTSRRLGLRTEASGRFEKGLDAELTVTALKRAAYLLQEICGAEVCSPVTDQFFSSKQARPRIHLGFDRLQQVLGMHISPHDAKSILQRLGFQVPVTTKSNLEAVAPSWRADVSLTEDLIEEIIRIWGYERIPSTLPSGLIKAPQPNLRFERLYSLRTICASSGLYECIHIPFLSEKTLEKTHIPLAKAIKLPNPLSLEMAYLAPSHLPAFLESIAGPNLAEEELGLFEIGKLFAPPSKEEEYFSFILRSNGDLEELYRRAKGTIQAISHQLGLPTPEYKAVEADTYFSPGTTQELLYNGESVGQIGVVHPDVVASHKIRRAKQIVFVELKTELLFSHLAAQQPYIPTPTFPGIERDLTLIVSLSTPVKSVISQLQHKQSPLLMSFEVKEVYKGKPLSPDQKAITLHFSYNGQTRTLEDTEVSADQERLTTLFRSELQAIIND